MDVVWVENLIEEVMGGWETVLRLKLLLECDSYRGYRTSEVLIHFEVTYW